MNAALALARWKTLPRDARDTLFQLTVIGWTMLPHAAHLPGWCIALAGVILAWRGHLAITSAPLPGRWMLMLALLVAGLLTVWSEGTLLGKEAGVTMLVVLMALKTLELRARRDAMVVFFLGFFLVLTNFLYSQSLFVAFAMLLSVWGLLTALVLANMPVGTPPLAQAGALAARAALLGAPVMVALFLLFPRIAPLWGVPQDAAGRTGLSGTLRLGGVAEIANDDSVALRVRFRGPAPPPQALYFRGPVLSMFDGREWSRLQSRFPSSMRPNADVQTFGMPLRYEVTIEPSRLPMLPLLELTPDRPDSAPQLEGYGVSMRSDLQWQLDRPLTERMRFEGQAWLLHRHGPRSPVIGLRDLVELPPGHNPRTLGWAAELRRHPDYAQADARTLAGVLLEQIRSGGFTYTLEPGTYGRDAIDEFWFDRKLGFCEHYAAAFVVLMRALDVPARIVTGYQGADAVPVDGWYVVRQSNAHAWAEFWQPGEGWVRVDPTSAVAPDRIRGGRVLPPQPGLVAGAINSVSPQLLAQLRGLWERADNRWNQWVLNYSRGQQFELLKSLGVESPRWQDLAYAMAGLLALGSLGGVAWALYDRWRQDPWARLQRRVRYRLLDLGVVVHPHEAPRARAARVRERLGAAGEPVARALDALDLERYARPGRRLPDRRWWTGFNGAVKAARATPRVLPQVLTASR